MQNYRFNAKILLHITNLFMVILFVMTFTLPFLVTWYVETMGRSPDLATVVMVTCYPCVPLGFITLLSMRRLLKSLSKGEPRDPANLSHLNKISLCCLIAGLVMFVAGFFYMPFFIAGAAAITCSLFAAAMRNMLAAFDVCKADSTTETQDASEGETQQ